jgi:hypothetical protein
MNNMKFAEWKGMVVFLIQMAGANPEAIIFNFEQAYQAGWGAMDAARQYLFNLQQHLVDCADN